MANAKLVLSDAALIAACAYGFIGGGVSGKKYATVALILYLASGILSIARELTNDGNIRKCDYHCFYISNTCGIDLLVTDICILSSVEEKWALLNLVPPAIDLIMKYASNNWDAITPMTHIVSIGLMGYFAFKDSKYILIVSGVAFLFSIFGTKNDERFFVNTFNAIGVFASTWFLGGKDLKDMGIDIGYNFVLDNCFGTSYRKPDSVLQVFFLLLKIVIESGVTFEDIMASEILMIQGRKRLLDRSSLSPMLHYRFLTSGEIATALRPFYFSVHPDLFGKFPAERATNENSLQILSSYIENLQQKRSPRPANLLFYLRPMGQDMPVNKKDNLKPVNIKLAQGDVRKTVKSILTMCNLPTTYVDSRPQETELPVSRFNRMTKGHGEYNYKTTHGQYNYTKEEISHKVSKVKGSETLLNWLSRNVDSAKMKLNACEPVREEISRLQVELSRKLGTLDIGWDCGWNITSFRGCLQALQALSDQHSEHMEVLRGRRLIFGSDTGVSMEGYVLLNSAEVRHNWLDFLKNLSNQDEALKRLPYFERALSQVLKDIRIARRKFQPHTMATNYENNLRRLTTTLGDCQGKGGYPKTWPNSLDNFELVVETEAGPMMLSPTGQFILPCSCPSFLLVSFISENMGRASELLNKYMKEKYIERELHQKCLNSLDIITLDKDDCITPQKMIVCCTALHSKRGELKEFLKGTRVTVTNYYSVLSDGQLCIPWNWKL